MMKIKAHKGQSLVEVVVAVGVIVIIATALVSGTSGSIARIRQTKTRIQATKYTQEGLEIARTLRDADWPSFASRTGTYCVNATGTLTKSDPCLVNIDTIYTRTLHFTPVGDTITVISTVTWEESGVERRTQLTQEFTKWK